MKKQFVSGIIASVISLTLISAQAQTPVQWSRTLQLEGNWEGPAALNLGGQIFNVTYRTDFKTGIDGNALTMEEGFSDPALGEFKGLNLIGYSPYDDMIHWFSADNFGTAHEHTGSWLTPKHFYMEHHSIQAGQPFAEYIHIKLRANNSKALLTLVATLGADTVETITGTLFLQSCNRAVNMNTEEEETSETEIYPNPSGGRITIESPVTIDEIKITNESGQVVCGAKPGETTYSLELKTKGIYFVTVTSAGKTETKKIVLEK